MANLRQQSIQARQGIIIYPQPGSKLVRIEDTQLNSSVKLKKSSLYKLLNMYISLYGLLYSTFQGKLAPPWSCEPISAVTPVSETVWIAFSNWRIPMVWLAKYLIFQKSNLTVWYDVSEGSGMDCCRFCNCCSHCRMNFCTCQNNTDTMDITISRLLSLQQSQSYW